MFAHPKRFLCILLCLVIILTASMPATVFAEYSLWMEDHYSYGEIPVTGLTIDDVDVPAVGMPLDDRAVVYTYEGVVWEIPVLWIDDTLSIATEAQEGRTYLPALAFYIPSGYYAADAAGMVLVKLSDALAMLFGSQEIISVYHAQTGIGYILPASLRGIFLPNENEHFAENDPYGSNSSSEAVIADTAQPENYGAYDDYSVASPRSLVDIYCAQTARDNLSDEDLENLLDLVINKLEPQAVNLLIEKFPAFGAAADEGKIGREIGLYVYYTKGDHDGDPAHENTLENAMAYTDVSPYNKDGEHALSYVICVNADTLVAQDIDGNAIVNSGNGKKILDVDGKKAVDLENTLVHEMFHAFIADYNRTGMIGFNCDFYPDQLSLTDEDLEKMNTLKYPSWFVEGAAACVENTYQSGKNEFDDLLNEISVPLDGSLTEFRNDGTFGYLAVLYLSELAARQTVGTSFSRNGDETFSFSSEKILQGLNNILEELHSGKTLDEVITVIAPRDESGNAVYSGTEDFENKFICGPEINGVYADCGDPESLDFTANYLTYMQNLSQDPERSGPANGSILFDFEEDFSSPLDSTKEEVSDYYKIVESNSYVESTVQGDDALSVGGRSELNLIEAQEEDEQTESVLTETAAETAAQSTSFEAGSESAATETLSSVPEGSIAETLSSVPEGSAEQITDAA